MSTKRIVAEINLRNIEDNIKALYEHMPVKKPIVAVIKANGYGHGSCEIAKILETNPCVYGYAVATSEEALNLRNNNIQKPILILGYVFEEDYEILIKENIAFSIFDIRSATTLNDIAKSINTKALVHIKVDTGMSRIGVLPNDDGLNTVSEISKLSNLTIEGIFTHFARADELNRENALLQLQRFDSFIDKCQNNNINFKIIHCSNSASILQIPEAHHDIVRAGIVIYGLWPSDEMESIDINLKPAMSLKSHIVHIKNVDANIPISYGGTYVSDKPIRVATIPVGYADGYPRSLSNKGYVLINGRKANILGRVCMDQMMVDVSDIDANVLDEVILIGKSGNEEITAENLGDMSGRFNYELVCDISPRVPREFIY